MTTGPLVCVCDLPLPVASVWGQCPDCLRPRVESMNPTRRPVSELIEEMRARR